MGGGARGCYVENPAPVHYPVFFLADVVGLRDDGRRLHSMLMARAEQQRSALKGSGQEYLVEEGSGDRRRRRGGGGGKFLTFRGGGSLIYSLEPFFSSFTFVSLFQREALAESRRFGGGRGAFEEAGEGVNLFFLVEFVLVMADSFAFVGCRSTWANPLPLAPVRSHPTSP